MILEVLTACSCICWRSSLNCWSEYRMFLVQMFQIETFDLSIGFNLHRFAHANDLGHGTPHAANFWPNYVADSRRFARHFSKPHRKMFHGKFAMRHGPKVGWHFLLTSLSVLIPTLDYQYCQPQTLPSEVVYRVLQKSVYRHVRFSAKKK